MKICCKCKMSKPLSEFGKLKKSNDGLRYDCKFCRKIYNSQNKNSIKEYNKKYWDSKKNELCEKNKLYRINNKENIFVQKKMYRELNNDKIKEYMKKYLPIKKEKIKLRRNNDIQFRISENLRTKIHTLLANKERKSSMDIIDCCKKQLCEWLEYQFDNTMSWNNYGSVWHIDHVIPINSFDMTKPTDVEVCFNWKNLQPLERFENQSKSNNINKKMIFYHIVKQYNYINKHNLNDEYYKLLKKIIWIEDNIGQL